MRAICFIQETKDSDLTQRQQQLICHRALRKLLWPCELELFAQAGTEEQPISLRPGMVDLMRAAAAGEVDVLIVTDIPHLHCSRAELDGLLMSLLRTCIAAAPNWTGCSCRCCNTVFTPLARTTASGSSRADGTGWRCRGMMGSCTNEYCERSFASPAGLGVCARRQRQPCAA